MSHIIVIPYSWRYWQELNLAVGSKMAIAKILRILIWWFGTGLLYIHVYNMQSRKFGGF